MNTKDQSWKSDAGKTWSDVKGARKTWGEISPSTSQPLAERVKRIRDRAQAKRTK